MKITEIAFVGYPVTDLRKARAFYEGILGLTVARTYGDENRGWIEYDIGPATLAIGNGAPDWKAASGGGSVALEVDDFQASLDHLRVSEVRCVAGPYETPVCHLAAFSDPDGNTVTIHKRKAAW